MELLGHRVYISSNLVDKAKLISKVNIPIYILTAVHESSHCSLSLSALDIIFLSQPFLKYVNISCYGFNLYFSDANEFEQCFIHQSIPLCEVPVHGSYSFFHWLIYEFLIDLQEFLLIKYIANVFSYSFFFNY